MPDLSELPQPLVRLMAKLLDAVAALTGKLEAGDITIQQWQREMERLLVRYHVAAYMTGQDSEAISDAARAVIVASVQEQLGYLDKFAAAIGEAGAWMTAWGARAGLYALAIKSSYWRGRTWYLSLPGYPAQGVGCYSNCTCFWDIQSLNRDKGDFDCYWRKPNSDSCKECIERANKWNPYKIRGGKGR